MFYNAEEFFIDKFIACLRKLSVTEIPFDNTDFYKGIEQMRQYFQNNRENIGKVSDEISLLFIKNPFEKNFSRFRDAISEQNGWYMSFENPEYTIGIIKIDNTDADDILKEHDLNISEKCLYDFAKAFCAGANIQMQQQG